MPEFTPFAKKIVTVIAGAALVALAAYLPEAYAEWKEELGGFGLLLIGWAIRAPGDGPGPGSRVTLGGWAGILALTFVLAGCGSAVPKPVRIVVDCAKEPSKALVEAIIEHIWLDGGPDSKTASERLVALARDLVLKHGLDVVRCAVAKAKESLSTEPGTHETVPLDDETPGDEAAQARADDLLRQLSQ